MATKRFRIKPFGSLLFLYSMPRSSNKVASETSIIGFAMSKDKTLNKPKPANKMVVIVNRIFMIFIRIPFFYVMLSEFYSG